MFVVLHPADVSDADPAERNPVLYVCGAIILLIGICISRVVGIGLAIVLLAVIQFQRVQYSRKWKGWQFWPVTMSTVELADVREARRHRKGVCYIAELAYSYSIQNEYYSGFCRCAFWDEKEAWRFVETFRGKTIPVHYKPEAPELSVMTGKSLEDAQP